MSFSLFPKFVVRLICLLSDSIICLCIRYSRCGDPHGHDWAPPECDVSIRPGWFWHSSEKPKSAATLLDLYYRSVGRNCLLLLNVPPNSSGLISEDDIQVLQNFTELRSTIFSNNLAQKAIVTATSTRGIGDPRFSPSNILKEGIFTYWAPEENQSFWSINLDLGQPLSFNVLQLQEPIHMGQRVIKFHLDILSEGEWQMVTNGTTVGYRRLMRFSSVKSQWLRLVIDESRADPLIAFLGIYLDQFSTIDDVSGTSSSSFNSSHIQMRTQLFQPWKQSYNLVLKSFDLKWHPPFSHYSIGWMRVLCQWLNFK